MKGCYRQITYRQITYGGTVPLSEIEREVFPGNKARMLSGFAHDNGVITATFTAIEPKRRSAESDMVATFANAVMLEVWKDREEREEWPLDIIGFDCYGAGKNRWKFVLNCDCIEWSWTSQWPVLTHTPE